MKNWKIAAALAVLLLGLGGLATWDEWKTKSDEKSKETSNLLTKYKPEDIKGFTYLTRGDSEEKSENADKIPSNTVGKGAFTASLSKSEGVWKVISPINENADQQVVQDLLKNILEYKYESEVANTQESWAKFGLDNPRRMIEIETNDGAKVAIKVGINSPVGFSAYTATSVSPSVYVGSQHIATSMSKTLFDFRDKKLLSTTASDVKTFVLEIAKQKPIRLEKSNDKWSIKDSELTAADTVQVNNFLDDVTGLKALEFVEPSNKEVTSSVTKDKSDIKVFVETTSGKSDFILISKLKAGLFAAVEGSSKVVKIQDDTFAKISKKMDDFKDKKIFQFQSSQVEKIDIDGKIFSKIKDEWYAAEDASKFESDGSFKGKAEEKPSPKSHVRGLIVDLEYAKAESILSGDDPMAKKLPPAPKNKIILNFAGTANLSPLTIDTYQVAENPDQIYLRPSNSKSIFKGKSSIISSIHDSVKLPAEDVNFAPPGMAAPNSGQTTK
jgi:hypothetical protein